MVVPAMASRCAITALLLNAVAAVVPTSTFSGWTVTSRYVMTVSTSVYTYRASYITETYSDYRTIKSTVTPTVTPTSYYSDNYQEYDYVTIVSALYPPGAVASTDLVPDYTDDSYTTQTAFTELDIYMPVTLTAPASCPTPFTVTSTAEVDVPSAVTDQLKPTSTGPASTSRNRWGTTYTYQTWYLSAGAAPYNLQEDDNYMDYVTSCIKPPYYATFTGSPTSTNSPNSPNSNSNDGDGDGSFDGSDYCDPYAYYGCNSWKIYVIVLASVIPGLFLLGFLESYFWFRRLMLGKAALRFGTICWILISLWIICFTRTQSARSAEDQAMLRDRWRQMSTGAAFKAWWKWGFRHRYPEPLLGQYSRNTVGFVPVGEVLPTAQPQQHQYPMGFFPQQPNGAPQYHMAVFYGPRPDGWQAGPTGGFIPSVGYLQAVPSGHGIYHGPMPPTGWTPNLAGGGGFVPTRGTIHPLGNGPVVQPTAAPPSNMPPGPPPQGYYAPQPQGGYHMTGAMQKEKAMSEASSAPISVVGHAGTTAPLAMQQTVEARNAGTTTTVATTTAPAATAANASPTQHHTISPMNTPPQTRAAPSIEIPEAEAEAAKSDGGAETSTAGKKK